MYSSCILPEVLKAKFYYQGSKHIEPLLEMNKGSYCVYCMIEAVPLMESWDNEGQGKQRCEEQEIRISPALQAVSGRDS